MVIAALGLAAALVQGQGPLARAESLLVAGDTARVIAVLESVPIELKKPSDDAVSAWLALLWVNRSRRSEQAQSFVRSIRDSIQRDDEFFPTLLSTPGRRALLQGAAVEDWGRSLVPADKPGIGDRRAALARSIDTLRMLLADSVEAHSLLAGAVGTVIAQYDIRLLIDRVRDAMPTAKWSPTQCHGAASGACAVKEDGSSSEPSLRTWMERDSVIHDNIARARATLSDGLHDPWPFRMMALQSLIGIELLFGSDTTLAALEPHVADVGADSTTALRLRAMLLGLGGRPDSAHALMDRHRALFAPLDTAVGVLEGRLNSSPAALWRTGWPLYLEPFNERLVVHRARVIAAGLIPTMTSRLSNLDEFAPSADVIRRGLARRLERMPDGQKRIIAFVSGRTQETLLPALRGEGDRVDLDLSLAARAQSGVAVLSGFAPRFYERLRDLPHQAMRYQRNGQALAAFFAQPPKPARGECQYETGFFLFGSDLRLLRRSQDTLPAGQAPRQHYSVPVSPGSYVYSIEARDTTCRVAARARYVFAAQLPGPGLAISDVLLVQGNESFDPRRVSEGIPVTGQAGLEVAVGAPVSFYWEIYGVRAAGLEQERLMIEVDAIDVRRGKVPVSMLGEVQRRAEGASADASVRYPASVPAGSGPLGVALTVRIPAAPGAVCRVRIIVTDQHTHEKATGTRTFYIQAEPK